MNGNSAHAKYYNLKTSSGLTDHMDELEAGYSEDGLYRINRYGASKMNLNLMTTQFDVSRFPDPSNMPMPYTAHIIMTRPNLNYTDEYINLASQQLHSNYGPLSKHPTTAALFNDPEGRFLFSQLTRDNSGIFMPLVYNKAMSMNVNDMSMETVPVGKTFYGHNMIYAMHNEEHRVAGTLSIPFRNDRFLSILKMMTLWYNYIQAVSFSDSIQPSEYDQKHGIIDYMGSIYYLITTANHRDIVFWQKFTGVMPNKIPLSYFNSNDGPILEDTINIDFSYSVASDPWDPNVLFDIDILNGMLNSNLQTDIRNTGQSSSNFESYNMTAYNMTNPPNPLTNPDFSDWRVVPNSFEVPFALGNAFAYRPFIEMHRSPHLYYGSEATLSSGSALTHNQGVIYKLVWRKGWAKGVDYA